MCSTFDRTRPEVSSEHWQDVDFATFDRPQPLRILMVGGHVRTCRSSGPGRNPVLLIQRQSDGGTGDCGPAYRSPNEHRTEDPRDNAGFFDQVGAIHSLQSTPAEHFRWGFSMTNAGQLSFALEGHVFGIPRIAA